MERFAGKVIAITGYEQDQVMVTPTGKPGQNPSQDVSVPINWAYNASAPYFARCALRDYMQPLFSYPPPPL